VINNPETAVGFLLNDVESVAKEIRVLEQSQDAPSRRKEHWNKIVRHMQFMTENAIRYATFEESAEMIDLMDAEMLARVDAAKVRKGKAGV